MGEQSDRDRDGAGDGDRDRDGPSRNDPSLDLDLDREAMVGVSHEKSIEVIIENVICEEMID